MLDLHFLQQVVDHCIPEFSSAEMVIMIETLLVFTEVFISKPSNQQRHVCGSPFIFWGEWFC